MMSFVITIDKYLTSDNAHRYSIRQAVKKRCLTSTRYSYERCQSSGLYPPINLVQYTASIALDTVVVAGIAAEDG